MSKGTGKLQRSILDVLAGKVRTVYRGNGALTTGELADELSESEIVQGNRRVLRNRIYQALLRLHWAGKLDVARAFDDEHGGRTWSWSLPKSPEAATP